MKGELPQSCDVAVIGAGVGGLTAGAVLAKAGLQVCVVEAAARPGGYVAGFKRKGFTFDSAIHWLNQCGPGGVVHKVFSHLGSDLPEAPPMKRIRRYKGESFDYLLTSHPDELKERLKSDFPADARSIESLFGAAEVLGGRITAYAHMMRTKQTRSWWERGLQGLILAKWSFPFWRFASLKAEEGLDKHFKSPALKRIFCSESDFLSILVPIGWAYAGDFQHPPKGGSQSYAGWLCGKIADCGSTVVLRAAVERVLLDGGRAMGLRLEDGRELAARYVIAACDVEALYERMLPQGAVPQALLERLRAAELYDSGVTLSLGLDTNPKNLGFDEELIFLSRDGIAREDHNSGDPEKAGLNVLAPSIRDPSLAPDGKGTLTIYASANIGYGSRWHTGPDLNRGDAYQAFKQDYAATMIRRVEEAVSPGLKDHIEILDIATPVTHLRYTGNRNGSIMGAMFNKTNVTLKLAHYQTPVQNLYLGGQWAELGGGVPIAVKAGANSALLILQQESRPAFEEFRAVLDKPYPIPSASH